MGEAEYPTASGLVSGSSFSPKTLSSSKTRARLPFDFEGMDMHAMMCMMTMEPLVTPTSS